MEVFDSEGKFIRSFAIEPLPGKRTPLYPNHAFGFDKDDNIVFADQDKVLFYTTHGAFLWHFHLDNDGYPSSVCVDSSGRLVVADTYRYHARIWVIEL